MGGVISGDQIKRFRDLALLVLEEDNPAFELAPDQRWMANLYGKTHSLSQDLRRSIVETLALMATFPTADGPVARDDLKGTVRWVLERALPPNATWQRWASFGHNLTIVAEADPELFLRRVEVDLGSNDPELPKLFQDQSHSMFSGAIHSDLLWALEGLAWTPDYLPRVALCLAKLAALDPGGTYANRPSNSLREIFLVWLWHTNAPLEDRVSALSGLIKAEPSIGWKLLRDLLPSGTSSISHNTHMPRWRPWADGWSRQKVHLQMHAYAMAVANLTIKTAGEDAQRWSEVLDGMLRYSPEIINKVFSVLEGISEATESSNPEAKFALWSEMRQLLSRHERYSDAQWAFDKTVRDRMAAIRNRLEPTDAMLKHHWLFNHQAELPEVDVRKDYVAHDRALRDARLLALREIIAQTGAVGVFELLDLASDANSLGWLIGANGLLDWESLQLPKILETSDNQRLTFINAFIGSRYNADGWTFVNRLPIAGWSVPQIATFARCLPFGEEVWQWLGQFGADVENEYWRHVRAFLREPNLKELRIATKALIRAGRGFAAIEVLHYSASSNKLQLPSGLIADVLEGTLDLQISDERSLAGDIHYSVQQLVKSLQDDEAFDRVRLARIEWGFLPLLDRNFSEVGPDTLVSAIQSEPKFYVDLLKTVYRGENDRPGEDPMPEQEQLMARHANRLLDGLSRLPGTHDDGTLDYCYLLDWVKQVQSMSAACDRRAICDLTLGQFIARGSQRLEGNWPSPELAALMEDVGSDELFDGFINGVLNSRGVVSRDPRAGGQMEHRLVERYRQLAQNTHPTSPKLAEAFLELARHYESYAKLQDDQAQRERLGR